MIVHARIAFIALFALLAVAGCTSPEDRAAAYADSAQKLYDAGDYDKARLEARNALQIQPKNVKASWVAAQVAERKGEMGEMAVHLATVIGQDPQNETARVKLGTLLVYSQDYAGAGALADQALALAPDDPEAHILKARVLLQKSDVKGAMAALDHAIELEPWNVSAALLRGLSLSIADPEKGLADMNASIVRIGKKDAKALRQARINLLFKLKRFDAIEAELKALATEYPDEDYQNRLAMLYVDQQRLPEAEAVLKEAVAANPKNATIKVALAQFQSRYLKQPEEAEKTLEKYIAEDPSNLQLQLMLGTFYDASKRVPDALATYEKIAAASPLTPEGLQARNEIAALALRSNDVEKARKQLEAILKDSPENTQALLARGEMNYAAGRYQDAIADLRAVLSKEPNSELGLLLLARTHVAVGDRALATDAYRRLLTAHPQQLDALAELPPLLAAGGQNDEARALLQQGLEADPKNAKLLGALVDVLLAANDLPGAEKRARELAALDTPDGVGYRQVGRVLEARKQYPEAFQAYQKSLAQNANSTLAFTGAVRSLLVQGKGPQAVDFIRAHLERYPDHVNARVALGEVLSGEGKLDEARETLENVVTQRPEIASAYLALAGANPQDGAKRIEVLERGRKALPGDKPIAMALAAEYEAAGRYDDAIGLYDAMVKANPEDYAAVNNLASLLIDHKTDAESHKRALALAQAFSTARNPAWLDTLGWAHYIAADYDDAVRFLELAVAYTERPSPLVRYHLGMAYMKSGNPTGAREELTKVLNQTGAGSQGNEEAKLALAKLDAKK